VSRRFLIACWPFTGHLLPQMSIAMALRERGHKVAFYSGEAVRATVQGEGFEFFAFEEVEEQRITRLVESIDTGQRSSRPGRGRLIVALREWLVETIPDQVTDLRAVLARWRPDAIATDLSMWAPIVVLRETERIPVALSSTFMGPLIPGPDAPAFGFGIAPPKTGSDTGVGQQVHGAAAAVSGRQHPRARLQPTRSSADGSLHRELHLVSAEGRVGRLARAGSGRPSLGPCHRELADNRRSVSAPDGGRRSRRPACAVDSHHGRSARSRLRRNSRHGQQRPRGAVA
jgi:hypothetical protein